MSNKKPKINARRKGLSFEREICTQLAYMFPRARRHLEFNWMDAEKKMDIQGTHPWIFQCKRGKNYTNPKVLFETIADEGEYRVLITKADYTSTMAIMEWEVFKMLLEIAYGFKPPFRSEEGLQEERAKLNITQFPPFNNDSMGDLGL